MHDGCGPNSSACFAWYDHDSRCWRTSAGSLAPTAGERWATFSGDWPASGTLRSGTCFARPTWAHRTAERGGSAWPTATVEENNNRKGASPTSGDGLATAVRSFWATPQAHDAKGSPGAAARTRGSFQRSLAAEAGGSWPTPSASLFNDAEDPTEWLARAETLKAKHGNNGAGMPLAVAAKIEAGLPRATPKARDYRDTGTSPSEHARHSPGNAALAGGALNPSWVEALMGFPADWTLTDGPQDVESPSTHGSRPARALRRRTDERG